MSYVCVGYPSIIREQSARRNTSSVWAYKLAYQVLDLIGKQSCEQFYIRVD